MAPPGLGHPHSSVIGLGLAQGKGCIWVRMLINVGRQPTDWSAGQALSMRPTSTPGPRSDQPQCHHGDRVLWLGGAALPPG